MEEVKGTLSDPLYGSAYRAHQVFYELMWDRLLPNDRAQHRTWPPEKAQFSIAKGSSKHFYTLAQICRDHQWNIEVYVRTCFELAKKRQCNITPADLVRDQMVHSYGTLEAQGQNSNNPKNEYEEQVRQVIEYTRVGSNEYNVLYSPVTPFAAWFRVLYPERISGEMMDTYGLDAHDELKTNRPLRMWIRNKWPAKMELLEQRHGRFGDSR